MRQLSEKYPDDFEAQTFYAFAILAVGYATPTDTTLAKQLQASALLEKLWKKNPNHPGVIHYLIHSYDVPSLAPRGLPYARRYADLAPDAPHALHMPAHTFTRVGLWQESIDTNIRSHDAAIKRGDSGEALHAMDYMVYAYLQTAQDTAAKRVVDDMLQLHGAAGLVHDSVMERLHREIRSLTIYEGTSEIQRLIIAESLRRRAAG